MCEIYEPNPSPQILKRISLCKISRTTSIALSHLSIASLSPANLGQVQLEEDPPIIDISATIFPIPIHFLVRSI